ncbi:serine proteinase stubble isoform X2 [Acyrthosiphon pisum]|uniref:Peptidase S1 domain-containing protein n=1 Tax=Acyrthosiphon pisum TaxID=7029 RepID=A0A8R2A4E8_ACYPI|nr:serine proteinase stubble isoform X2 [Acyrthosiphon pisum]|eukprot:XP_001943207.1 PREDICTED: serine proteinase stubble isoform X2 [Acyrthosiphon pisum]
MKRHGICSAMKSSYDKTLLLKMSIIGLIISQSLVKSYPSWDTPTTLTDFGRNIRQLPCVSRRSGETGVCMFAYSCAKANGTHLGTCIDRFYFGSCCKTQSITDIDAANEPDNYLNNVDNNDVAGPSATTDTKTGAQLHQQQTTAGTTADRYSTLRPSSYATATGYPPSTAQSYKPTGQFAVSSTPSTTTSTSTSRTQYTEISVSSNTKPTFASSSSSSISSSSPPTGSISSSYSTTISQSTKPMPSTTFSTAKPMVKPSSFRPPPIRDQATTSTATATVTTAAVQKPKPQTARPTVQFSVPSSTTGSSYEPTAKPSTTGQSYTTMTSMRPGPQHSSTVTATFSTTKPVVKPSSTTYKSTIASAAPSTTTMSTSAATQKVKPQTIAKPAVTTTKPKPTTGKPDAIGSTVESVTGSTYAAGTTYATGSTYATRSTVENVTEIISNFTAATANGQNQTPSYGSTTTVTSTSPTLVTWTTLDKVPVVPAENTKPPPPSMTHKPSVTDGSTLPSWVKLPVETHEPNTVSAPTKESSSGAYSSTMTMSKPTTLPSPSDNDIVVINNNAETTYTSTQNPSSTLSMLMQSTSTDSVEAGNAPLNMSNYKDVCGRRLFPTARIVGGEKVSFGKWPWQISLRQWRTSTYLHKCGAALFNENWAVTAAHCVENVPPSDLLLRLGEHDLSVEEEPYGYEERRIQIVASHPQFDPRTFEYDLALLRFYEPVTFQPNIIPVCVPEDDSNFVGSSAYVTGWGRLYEDGPLPSVLQEVTVPVINNSVCETMYRAAGYIEHIPDIFICAGWKKGGFDSCEGDSGGPMVIQRPDKRWLLAGIISWGIGCAEPNQPGVYTRISKFKDWINQILQF